jgi:hypothetical protein
MANKEIHDFDESTTIEDADELLFQIANGGNYKRIAKSNLVGTASGDMTKAVYDPTTIEGDAFSMDNMVETSTKKVLTDTERGLIASALQTISGLNISSLTNDSGYITGYTETDPVFNSIHSEYTKYLKKSRMDPQDLYRRHAGEVEARAVQARMNLTPDERRARPPWLDYDVPEGQQIVRFGQDMQASERAGEMSSLVEACKR